MARRRKRCRFCKELFLPDARLKGRQYACGKSDCQKERHRQNCAAWNSTHSDQFEGRYPDTLAWLARHPGYLAEYRLSHPEAAEEHRRAERERLRRRRRVQLDIQDSIWLQVPAGKGFGADQSLLDIQDSISRQLFVLIGLSASLGPLDIQDPMAPSLRRLYSSGKEIWQWAKRDRERAAV